MLKYFKPKITKMENKIKTMVAAVVLLFAMACNSGENQNSTSQATTDNTNTVGQSGVKDDVSAKNVVQVAIGSKDHTTLVAAVKAAELVDVLSNAGPFTVFAPPMRLLTNYLPVLLMGY